MVMDSARIIHKARGYDGLTISMFQPYHGTELRRMAVEAGFMDDDLILSGGKITTSFNGVGVSKSDDVFKLNRTLSLYCFYDESEWDLVQRIF